MDSGKKVLWMVWLGLLAFVFVYWSSNRILNSEEFPEDPLFWLILIAEIILSFGVRFLVLSKKRNHGQILVYLIIGLSLSEGGLFLILHWFPLFGEIGLLVTVLIYLAYIPLFIKQDLVDESPSLD